MEVNKNQFGGALMSKSLKSLHCKKAKIHGKTVGTLQLRLESVFKAKVEAKKREQPLTTNRFRVVAQHYPYSGALAGIMLSYERGSKAASLINDPSETHLAIEHFAAPQISKGKQREWVEGLLYFLIKGDYIVYIQSTAVRLGQMEAHFSWLLSLDQKIPISVILEDKTPKDVAKKIQKDHVKSFVVNGALISPEENEGDDEETNKSDSATVKTLNVSGRLLDAVKAALNTDNHGFNWPDGLDGNLEAKLELTYRRETTDSAQKLLDKLAIAFRKTEGLDTTLVLNSGDTIRQNELRLSAKRSIDVSDRVISPAVAFAAMHEWMEELANSGQL